MAPVSRKDWMNKKRMFGEYPTPTVWVDEAHKMLSEAFGEDWKERFVVWDCAAGTLNLTRDYRFKELYCSTINAADLETARQAGYNPEATLFQFDFLNDPIEKLPEGLQKAIAEGREILFLINPPYGTANNFGTDDSHKAGIAVDYIVNARMRNNSWGAASQQLYAQFLFRIHELSQGNISIANFSPSLYKTGPSYKAFREKFYTKFEYVDGMLFNAFHFDGVSDGWGVDFSIWKPGIETRDSLALMVKDATVDGIIELEKKQMYNLDNNIKHANAWTHTKCIDPMKSFTMSSALKITDKEKFYDKLGIGVLISNGGSVYTSATDSFIIPRFTKSNKGGTIINANNYEKAIALFAARKLIQPTWINQKDEYLAPDETHPEFKQFTLDSIVYSLFNNSSQQSSLRGIEYKGQKWDIKNEFFWLPGPEERYVYKKLKDGAYEQLSADAKDIINYASMLHNKLNPYRSDFAKANPHIHLDCWDAGYAQLKIPWKILFPEDFKIFRKMYDKLSCRMRPLVYKLGFLK